MTPTLPFLTGTVDQVVSAYLEAAAWTEEFAGCWSDAARDLATFEVTSFLHLARWNVRDWTPDQLGHDFWLTRNGHGTGFWDRDFGTEETRTKLTDLSHLFGVCDCYVENGAIYFD